MKSLVIILAVALTGCGTTTTTSNPVAQAAGHFYQPSTSRSAATVTLPQGNFLVIPTSQGTAVIQTSRGR
jgi:hypothetical protein